MSECYVLSYNQYEVSFVLDEASTVNENEFALIDSKKFVTLLESWILNKSSPEELERMLKDQRCKLPKNVIIDGLRITKL